MKEKVIMNKKTGKLSLIFIGTWFGNIIQYDEWPDNQAMAPNGPFIFNDDKRFKLTKYEDMGTL